MSGAAAALGYWLTTYRRTWRGQLFSNFILPVLYLAAIGLGVGGYVDRDSAGSDGFAGVGYLAYLAPGLLVATAMQTTAAECTWPVYSSVKWAKTYFAQLATPLRVADVLAGHLGYVLMRAGLATAGFFVTMALFGTLRSPWSPAAFGVALLVSLAVAGPAYAMAAWAQSDTPLNLIYRFGVVPLTLFSGVFYPVDQLPPAARPLAWLSPLWHGVELARVAVLDLPSALPGWAHLGYLGLWVAAGTAVAHTALRRRMVI